MPVSAKVKSALQKLAAARPAPRVKTRYRALTSATVIAFSLTFVGAGVALLAGMLPANAEAMTGAAGSVDTGVVLLLVPLCALVLAILFEATRLALRGPVRIAEPRPAPALSAWTPGHGEG